MCTSQVVDNDKKKREMYVLNRFYFGFTMFTMALPCWLYHFLPCFILALPGFICKTKIRKMWMVGKMVNIILSELN